MSRSVRLIVCCCFVLGTTKSADATVLWRGDVQNGNLSQWTSKEIASSDRVTVVTNPVPDGDNYSMRVVVKQGDFVSNGNRNEVDYETDRPREGDERFYHWKTMFPTDYKSADYWQLFTQWHQYVSGGSPPLAIMVWGENIQLGNEVPVYFWKTPLVRGVWHDFIIRVIWSSSASVGGVELWYDGQHVLNFTKTATFYANDTVYLKQGLYRKNLITWDQVLYHADMTIATQLSDVMSDTGNGRQDAGTVEPVVDAGSVEPVVDAGSHVSDAGHHVSDAGQPPTDQTDAGTVTSPPVEADAGSVTDAGTTPPGDGTTPPDDGTTPPDDGTTPPDDGTTPPDDGTGGPPGTESPRIVKRGCTSAGAPTIALLLAGVWLLRRRKTANS